MAICFQEVAGQVLMHLGYVYLHCSLQSFNCGTRAHVSCRTLSASFSVHI